MLFIAPSNYPLIRGVEYVDKSIAESPARADHETSIIGNLL